MFATQRIPYQLTESFSKIIIDYLDKSPSLSAFYKLVPSLESITKAIENKEKQIVDRRLLVSYLLEQYSGATASAAVTNNITLLEAPTTFTICTAHQPNLFTGPLYFIYKIIHAIKLADELKQQFKEYSFVPVYYMGSEDADLAELNHFYVEGKKYEWQTTQTGAVGRMLVDKALIELLEALESQLSIHPFGNEWTTSLRNYFKIGITIQEATFGLIHHLFSSYGLVVMIADHPALKRSMQAVFEKDLFQHTSSKIVAATSKKLQEIYTEQAHARDINLFYLKDNIRERIELKDDRFIVHNTSITFSADEIKQELANHPDRFSPNVILRGLYQETILPNIAFIGGGGEVAYWLQLKELFHHYAVPYPILILRNSFLIIEKKWKQQIEKLGLNNTSIFQPYEALVKDCIIRNSTQKLSLKDQLSRLEMFYNEVADQAKAIDPTLDLHVAAIKVQALKKLQKLEKKMFRAEKRKFENQQNQLMALKEQLFPKKGLQERVDNVGYYFSKWGVPFIDELYKSSTGLEQHFTVLTIED
jgi:bacillithiol biosynthesis cysteine-adding enzyme BshC